MKTYFVYIMTNSSRVVLYTGGTNDLTRRVWEHQHGKVPGFTKSYRVNRLVYYEDTPDVFSAITREKEIKGWRRSKKNALVDSFNPQWRDLSATLFEQLRGPSVRAGRAFSARLGMTAA
jgi:putative endonuclease